MLPCCENSPSRRSSSVITRPPERFSEANKVIGGHAGDCGRIFGTQSRPNVQPVGAAAEALEPLFQAYLFGHQDVDAQAWRLGEQATSCGAEVLDASADKQFGTAEKPPMLAAHGAPDQCAVL